MSTRVPDDELVFATTADSGRFAMQARWLCESIRIQHPESEIVIFIPEQSLNDIKDTHLSYFREHCKIETGEIPIPEDPMSALTEAFIRAADLEGPEYVVQLDTDVLLLQPLCLPDEPGDTYVKPLDNGAQFWGHEDSRDEREALYRYFDLEPPSETLTSTVDSRQIPPFWNGGVVITKDKTLPGRWLTISNTIRNEYEFNSQQANESFNEQISLALALRANNVFPLPEHFNYNLECYLRCPPNVTILHYHKPYLLSLVKEPNIRRKLSEIGLPNQRVSISDKLKRVFWVLYYHSGRILSYRWKKQLLHMARKSSSLARRFSDRV